MFISLKTGRGGAAVDAAAVEPGLNAPCMTLYTSLCVKDIITRESEGHSRYEPLPSKDLKLLITDAMLLVSSMAYFNALSGQGRSFFSFFDATRRIIHLQPSRQGGGVSDTVPSPKRHTNS